MASHYRYRPNNYRLNQPSTNNTWLFLGVLVIVLALIGLLWVSFYLATKLDNSVTIPASPSKLLKNLVFGKQHLSVLPVLIFTGLTSIVLVLILVIVRFYRIKRVGQTRLDYQAGFLGKGEDITAISEANAIAKAKRLGIDDSFEPGILVGLTVVGNQKIYGSWEDMHLDIAGPRSGKTTSRVIPAIMAAKGSIVVTSNKRDVVDATRLPRENLGEVWVFDPQNIANEPPTWFWNPLSFVVDETTAFILARCFADGTKDINARTDAFFDTQGEGLLAGFLLAAAVAKLPISKIYEWVTSPGNDEPVICLRENYPLMAKKLEGVCFAPDKQRDGVYATAEGMLTCLLTRNVLDWIEPRKNAKEFIPKDFVTTGVQSLYSLSAEGLGTTGPLVAALTIAILDAAEKYATTLPSGRLSKPLLGVLDEAANICRWRSLPDKYSHYGSRGIVLMTFLQSWSQGVDVWGEAGMKKLWSTANIAVYAGGVKETTFLEDLVKLAGDYDKYSRSVSYSAGRGGNSTSIQLQRENIFTIADLQALPQGRMLVFASGTRPTLVQAQPWYKSDYAHIIEESLAKYDPTTP